MQIIARNLFKARLPRSSTDSFSQSRFLHIELGAREKMLLEEDAALTKFKSYKTGERRLQMARDVLTIAVVTGCCYEIMYRAFQKRAERQRAQ